MPYWPLWLLGHLCLHPIPVLLMECSGKEAPVYLVSFDKKAWPENDVGDPRRCLWPKVVSA